MRTFSLLLITAVSLWSLTIDEAVELAMQQSPNIHKAQSEVRFAQSGELEAEAAYHPTLDAGYNWQDVDKTTAFSYSPSYNYNLTAKYNLFSGFADKARIDVKTLETEAQSLLLTAQKADLKLEVVNVYTTYLKAEKTVKTQRDELSSLTRSYNDTKVRYEQGMIAKNELLLIDVQRLSAEQALFAAKSDLVRSRENLRRVLGGSLNTNEAVEDFTADAVVPADFDTLLEETYARRSELKALYRLRDASSAERTAVTGSFYPHVDLEAGYIINDKERRIDSGVIQHKDLFQTKVNVTWNLYNGRANEAQRKGILEKMSGQDADIAAMKLDLRYQLINAYEAYRVAQSAKNVATRAKESADENYRITADRYEYGQIDTLTLLVAQSNLTAARNAYNNAYYDLYTASVAIERVSGE